VIVRYWAISFCDDVTAICLAFIRKTITIMYVLLGSECQRAQKVLKFRLFARIKLRKEEKKCIEIIFFKWFSPGLVKKSKSIIPMV
jgi:hypothetical protein